MIIWLASYPKNGNTWLRSLLSAYYFTKNGNFINDKILKNIPQFPEKRYFTNFDYDKSLPTSTAQFWIKAQEIINKEKKKINVFQFDQIDFNLADYSSNTILVPKIQELSSQELILCVYNINIVRF